MTVYNENFEELSSYDLDKGELISTKRVIHHEAEDYCAEVSHVERVRPITHIKVVDVPGHKAHPAYDEEVEVVVYKPYSEEELIRHRREKECFPIINRGRLWYDLLSQKQEDELFNWYLMWLDAPATKVVPEPLTWVNNKIEKTEDVL